MSCPAEHVERARKYMLWTRATIFAVGFSFIVAERGLAPPYVFSDIIPSAPALWNFTFFVAGATTVLFGVTLAPIAGKVSLVTLVAAMSSRAFGLWFLTEARPLTPIAMYVGFFAVVTWAWPRIIHDVYAEQKIVSRSRREG